MLTCSRVRWNCLAKVARATSKPARVARPRISVTGAPVNPTQSASTKRPVLPSYMKWNTHRHGKSYYVSYRSISSSTATEPPRSSIVRDFRSHIIFAAIGAAGALWSWQKGSADSSTSREVPLSLPADPWLITGQQKKENEDQPTFWQRFRRFLLVVLRLFTGYTLMMVVIRFLMRAAYETCKFGEFTVLNLLVKMEKPYTALCRPVEPFTLASKLANWISQFSGTHFSYLGTIELLDRAIIEALPKKKLLALQEERYRDVSHPDWTLPYFSSTSGEDFLLSPQYMSFLVKSHRDGAIYSVDGYFSALPDLTPVPLVLYYNKVAHSLADLQNAKIETSWTSRLNSRLRVGEKVVASRDLTSQFRALHMPTDLSRLIDASDWKSMIGSSQENATLLREKSNTPQFDEWRVVGPSGEVRVSISDQPFSSTAPISVILPETNRSLEGVNRLHSVTISAARWCTYLEKNPIISEILGEKLSVSSSPVLQSFSTLGSDVDGKGSEVWFNCTGSRSTAEIHVQTVYDGKQSGRFPISPIIRIWAITEHGRLEIYENPRPRYQDMDRKVLSIPIQTKGTPAPLMASDIAILPSS